jgi:hypothetical protein
MKRVARFDRLLSDLRVLFEEAAGHAEIVDKLENFLSEKRVLGVATRRQRRSRGPALSPERKEAIREKLLRVLGRGKEGTKISALAKSTGLDGFRLRLILGELRAEKKIRVEGQKGGTRYFASASAPAMKPKTPRSRTKAKTVKRPKKNASRTR